MTTYGWTEERGTPPVVAGDQSGVLISHEFHGLSTGYRKAIAGVSSAIPASDWIKRFARSPGIRKDAVSWYGLDEWLRPLEDAPVSGAAVLAKLEEREFKLRVQWSPSSDDTLLVVFYPLDGAVSDFVSVHYGDVKNVLVHIRLDVLPPHGVVAREVQSDWQQEGRISGWSQDPLGHQRAARDLRDDLDRLVIDSVADIHDGAAYSDLVEHLIARQGLMGDVADERPYRLRSLWEAFRTIADGDESLPTPELMAGGEEAIENLVQAFRARAQSYAGFRMDDPVPEAPFRQDWPRLALKVALAHAASALTPDGRPSFTEISIEEGDVVATEVNADEYATSVQWSYDRAKDSVFLLVNTEDGSGNSVMRPEIRCNLEKLKDRALGHIEGIGELVAERIEQGEASGYLSAEDIEEEIGLESTDLLWKNFPLRRFYDAHLPRELREVARANLCTTYGSLVAITDEGRNLLAEHFPPVPGVTVEEFEEDDLAAFSPSS